MSRLSSSLPEGTEDYEKSQQSAADEGDRWFALVGAVFDKDADRPTAEASLDRTAGIVKAASKKILEGAVELLTKRNYKPFGSASVIASALRRCPSLFKNSSESTLASLFVPDQVETMFAAPSASYILSCLTLLGRIPEQKESFEEFWTTTVKSILSSEGSPSRRIRSITTLISTAPGSILAREDPDLQDFMLTQSLECAKGAVESWEFLETALSSNALEDSRADELTEKLVLLLDSSQRNIEAPLKALEIVAHKKGSLLSRQHIHVALVSKLLGLTEISDLSLSMRTTALLTLLEKHTDSGEHPIIGIVQENLENAGPNSLSVDTLVQQIQDIYRSRTISEEFLFPNPNIWRSELSVFLQDLPSPSLSLTSSLGSSYLLVSRGTKTASGKPRRDRRGYSVPARMALYTSKILSSGIDLSSASQEFQLDLLYLLCLTVELASDQLTLTNENGLWASYSSQGVLDEVQDFISSTRETVRRICSADKDLQVDYIDDKSRVGQLIKIMTRQARELNTAGLYSARALSGLLQSLTELHGLRDEEGWLVELDIMKPTPEAVLPTVAFVTGLGEILSSSKALNLLCNRLISDISGASPTAGQTRITIVLLNAVMSVYDIGELPVAHNRLVFAVRQISSWFGTPDDLDVLLSAETCRSLQLLFPNVKDVYGPYWERAIEYCVYLWNRASELPASLSEYLPCLQASMKLMRCLETIPDPNDDLVEALEAHARPKSRALIRLLNLPRLEKSTQPQDIVDSLLCRRIEQIPVDDVGDPSDLYSVIASESRSIQTAAFGLLHRVVPERQEKLSVDILLDKKGKPCHI
jgi:hypothetical protein